MGLFHKQTKEITASTLKIYFVCDAGMGSSAMGAGLLQKKLKKYKLPYRVKNCAIDQIPQDVDILVSHINFKNRIVERFPNRTYYGLEEFMDDAGYERIVKNIMLFSKKKEKETKKDAILDKKNIILNCKAATSDEAIIAMGHLLKDAGYIEEGYIQGMLNRDHSLTTYIGNDIAIPHGEYEVKDCVKKTGIAVMVYPDGIKWADGMVRIVIGIAAKNDDHMTILANIADKLGDMDVVEQVVKGDVDFIYNVLAKGDEA